MEVAPVVVVLVAAVRVVQEVQEVQEAQVVVAVALLVLARLPSSKSSVIHLVAAERWFKWVVTEKVLAVQEKVALKNDVDQVAESRTKVKTNAT